MRFSSATEHALRGLSEMAARGVTGRVMLDEVIAGTPLPRDFMAKVFQQLAKAGVLASVRGRGGGFTLARPPSAITLLEVVGAIEGAGWMDGCVLGLEACDDVAACGLHDLYRPIRVRFKDYLATTTLADMGAMLRSKPAWQATRVPPAAGTP